MKTHNHISFQILVGILVAGLVLGFIIDELYNNKKRIEFEQQSNSLVDFIISEWTGVDANNTIAGEPAEDLAQFPAKKELPVARLGYFPDTVRVLAKLVEVRYHIPAAVTLAQWALESSWGTNNLGVSNYFGHTFAATKQFSSLKTFVTRTEKIGQRRTMKFTVYKNIEECFDVHGKYLSTSKYYRAAFFTSSPENFVRVLGVYAEDGDYVTKLIAIIRRYKL